LYYHQTPTSKNVKGSIDVSMIERIEIGEPSSKPNSWSLITPGRVFQFHNQTSDERYNWVNAIDSILTQRRSIVNKTDETVDFINLTGFLFKASPSAVGGWQKRWFVLQENSLTYFEKEKAKKEKGIISLLEVKDVTLGDMVSTSTVKGYTFSIAAPLRSFSLLAPTEDERNRWVHALRTNILRKKGK